MRQSQADPLPRLVALSPLVPETTSWPELEDAIGHELVALTPWERQWLTVATLHRSSLYENSYAFPNISPACLTLLASAGKAAVNLELRRAIARAHPELGVPPRDEEANRVIHAVGQYLTLKLDVANRAQLGLGEAASLKDRLNSGGSARTLEIVAMQVAGWWSVMVAGIHLREFVDGLYLQAAAAPANAIGARNIFHKHFDALGPQFLIEESGPDHARTFSAVVSTKDGRTGKGEALSKKQAQQVACQDYLLRHAPHLLAETKSPARPKLGNVRRPAEPSVDARYAALGAAFDCKNPRPFSRALIHRSWVYENVPGSDTERDSNARLANLGSYVLIATLMRRRAAILLSQTTDPDPEVAVPVSLPDAALWPVFEALGLQPLVRVGAGLRSKPYADEMVANMVQAVLAASHIQWPDHATFEQHLPPFVAQFLTTRASTSLVDPTTRLQELAAELGLQSEETSSQTGLDHNSTYRVRLTVYGSSRPVTVEGVGRSKRAARQAAADEFLRTAKILSDNPPEVLDNPTARLLLLRQLNVLAASRGRWPRWQRAGRLAAHMLAAQDFELFERWAARVQELMGVTWQPDAATGAALADYYRGVSQPRRRRPEFTATLIRVADWVARAARQDEVVASWDTPVRELVALAAAHSTWMSTGEERPVTSIVDDWVLLNRGRFRVERDIAMHDVAVDPKTAAALLKVLQECASELSRLPASRIVLKSQATLQGWTLIIGSQGHSFSQLNGSILMQLLCEAAPRLSVYVPERHSVEINVKDSPRFVRENWLTAAAFGEPQADDYEAELARLIHDLKNEVIAARVASERTVINRTERLEAQLASSRHMDSAAALALRLRDADMLYAAADLVGSTDLMTFMRSYISDQIRHLSASIRILPPALTPAVVAIDEHALRAVLDNLIKNAEEALAEGEISLNYTAEPAEEVALIELTDSGGGIPAEVIEAFAAGRPITSSKREGSGLGLLGIRRILRHAGGNLELIQSERGTAWLITLPLVPPSDSIEASNE